MLLLFNEYDGRKTISGTDIRPSVVEYVGVDVVERYGNEVVQGTELIDLLQNLLVLDEASEEEVFGHLPLHTAIVAPLCTILTLNALHISDDSCVEVSPSGFASLGEVCIRHECLVNGSKDALSVLIDNLCGCHKLGGHPVHGEVHGLTEVLNLWNPLLVDDRSVRAELSKQVLTLLALHSLLNNLRGCEVGNGSSIAIDSCTIKRLGIRKRRTKACHRSGI